MGEVSTDLIEEEYSPLSKSDFIAELRRYVTEDEIEEYNRGLPSKETLDNYLKEYRNYQLIQEHGIAVLFVIHNIGTAKATDVSLTVNFPDEVLVFDLEEVRKMSEPKAPAKPRNLQEVAYERAHKAEISLKKMYAQLESLDTGVPFRQSLLSNLTIGHTIGESVEVTDNILEIETEHSIVHTKCDWFGGIYIVPLKKGSYKAEVTLMCSEYEEPEVTDIVFVCE